MKVLLDRELQVLRVHRPTCHTDGFIFQWDSIHAMDTHFREKWGRGGGGGGEKRRVEE